MNITVKLGAGWVESRCRSLKVDGEVHWVSGLLRRCVLSAERTSVSATARWNSGDVASCEIN